MHFKRLVTDLVDLGALGSGTFRLHLGPVKLKELLSACVEEFRPEAEAKKLSLGFDIVVGTPSIVQADEARLRQVLLILINNGLKFTKEGGLAVVAQRGSGIGEGEQVLSQGTVCAGVCLEILISDTGPGLSPEDRGRIMQVFARLENNPKGYSPGFSVALAARLCAAMGGALCVRAAREHGSTFIVRIPLGILSEEPARESAELAPAMSGLNATRCYHCEHDR
jgi:signal transduction histidine kinase